LAIDEFPVVFVAASQARGQTLLTGAEELRVKESDRIQTMADGLQTLGIDAEARADGMLIKSGQIGAGEVNSHGDHRIAMSFAVAGMCAEGPVRILDCANVNTSFPGFSQLMATAGMRIEVNS
jgi:3-phosphoshikimate 1-carboxyvinyltransferase